MGRCTDTGKAQPKFRMNAREQVFRGISPMNPLFKSLLEAHALAEVHAPYHPDFNYTTAPAYATQLAPHITAAINRLALATDGRGGFEKN